MHKNKNCIFSILDSPALGGAENYLLTNLKFLKKNGYDITLATYNVEIKKQYADKFKIIHLPYRLDLIGNKKGLIKFFLQAPPALFWLIKLLLQLKKRYRQVIVYTPGFTERLFFSPFIKFLKLKLIWVEFGPVDFVLKRNFGLPGLLYKAAAYFPDKVITISENSQKSLLKNSKINSRKIELIYPGTKQISQKQIEKYQELGEKWRTKQKLRKSRIITFVGRTSFEKEIEIALRALKNINSKNIKLVIIGDGPEKRYYEQLTLQLELSDCVLFVGYQDEKNKNTILATSNIFVFPSAWELEGFGMTTIEAMMLGIPVISSGHGPQKEIVNHQKNGLIFSPHNSSSLAKMIKLLLQNKNLATQLGQAGRELVLKRFTQEQMYQKTLKLIKKECQN